MPILVFERPFSNTVWNKPVSIHGFILQSSNYACNFVIGLILGSNTEWQTVNSQHPMQTSKHDIREKTIPHHAKLTRVLHTFPLKVPQNFIHASRFLHIVSDDVNPHFPFDLQRIFVIYVVLRTRRIAENRHVVMSEDVECTPQSQGSFLVYFGGVGCGDGVILIEYDGLNAAGISHAFIVYVGDSWNVDVGGGDVGTAADRCQG
mmetsp:Transcript_19326/g.23020  ORF Transcript_19326/g.23020 Transcript_19326/m.23020 type:complete len:205 (-) Transcript_19326:159-773(-)